MRARLDKLRAELLDNYWLIPALMAVAAILLASGLAQLDQWVEHDPGEKLGWLYGGGAEAAREVLSTIATAIMTVVSLTFSVTVVTLTLATSQFGSRLLHNFMRDRGNQVVLGTFISTFIYALLALRMIEDDGSSEWVPHITVLGGLLLALLSIAVLIYFINHVVEEIQANNVIARVSQELHTMIERYYPPLPGRPRNAQEQAMDEKLLHVLSRPCKRIAARGEGLLQAVETEPLLRWASRHRLVVTLRYRPGQFITRGCVAFEIHPAERVPEDAEKVCSEALLTGARRTLIQDVEFGVDQLVEVAVRALSPSVNDPFTAIGCLDRLAAALVRVMERAEPPALHYDAEGEPRLILKISDFPNLTRRAFTPIRQHASGNLSVLTHLLRVTGLLLERADTDAQRQVVSEQASLALRCALAAAGEPEEKAEIEALARALLLD